MPGGGAAAGAAALPAWGARGWAWPSAAIGITSASFACATTKKTCAVICVISRPSGLGTSKSAL